ncbi:MAG: PTS sugar transporter subunit IIA [Lachnospiraceae bacterium]|nr:PTS sugar transporter subunit IIA [Lachnospiraceae bacterium]
MKGILLISHGEMAKGMADSARLFFGDEIEQLGYLCLKEGDSPDEFGAQIAKKADELDTGDGVIILADLFGGTPCNQATSLLGEGRDLISGMNFAMLMQILSDRDYGDVDISEVVQVGKDGIMDLKAALSADEKEDDWLD